MSVQISTNNSCKFLFLVTLYLVETTSLMTSLTLITLLCINVYRFNPQRVIEQLRACGVLETIRISAAGFPSRCHYSEFLERYFMLLKWGQRRRGDNRAMGQYILQNCVKVIINNNYKY